MKAGSMGDVRFNRPYVRVREAEDPVAAIHALGDEDVVAALAAAAREEDAYLANVLATEAMNRARRWSMVFGRLSEGILTADTAGRVRFANPRAGQLLGYPPDALVGEPLAAVFETQPPGSAARALARALTSRETVHVLAEHLVRSGEQPQAIPVDLSVTPMLRDDEVEGAVLVLHDVSEREEAARRLAASEQRYRSLFVHNGDPVVAIDPAGTFTSVNPAAERVLGRTSRELTGRPFIDVVVPDDHVVALRMFEQALGGSAAHADASIRRPDGRRVQLEVVTVPIVVAGEVQGVYAIARDVTQRRRAEAELRHRQHVLVELARSPALRSGHLEEALDLVLRTSAQTLGVARVGYWELSPVTRELYRRRMHSQDGRIEGADRLHPEAAPSYLRALESARVVAAHDAQEDPRTRELKDGYLAPLGITSLLDAPVRVDGRVAGIVCHEHQGPPRTWTPGEQEFAAAAADLVATMVTADQRRRDLEALQDADRRMRLVLQHAPIMLFTLDAQGVVTLSEGRGLETLGLRPGELVGCSALDLYADQPDILQNIRRGLAGESFTSVDRIEGHVFETRWTPMRSDAPGAARVVGVSVDVTKTHRVMDALRESEDRFRTLAEASFEPILLHQEGRIVDANLAFLQMSGYSQGELLHKSVLDLVQADQREKVRAHMLSSADASYETVGLRRDGTTLPLVVRSREVTYRGERARVVALRDASLEKAAERRLTELVQSRTSELTEVRDQFHSLLEAAGEGLCGLDDRGRIIFLNPAGATMLGIDLGRAHGQDFHSTVHRADGPEDTCPITRSYRDGERHRVENDIFTRDDGTTFPVAFTSTPLVRDGKPAGAVIVFQETSERERSRALLQDLNEELGRRVAQLGNANRELEAFSYSVSHDLRAPLRGVDFYAQVLEEDHADALDEEGRRMVGALRQETRRLTRLVDDLLTLSRATTGELEAADVDLSQLAASVVEELRAGEPARQVDVVVDDDMRARGDPRLLRIALANLIGNAWKYTAHVPAPRVRVGRLRREDEDVFFVADNGIGFEPSQAARLFQAFERLPGASGFEGTGVGLSTVRRIVERHGGRVWAEGRPGQGATFFFTLGDAGESGSPTRKA